MQVALTDVVEVQTYDPFSQGSQSYLGAMDIEVGFAGKKSTEIPYDLLAWAAAAHGLQEHPSADDGEDGRIG
jgi:hypothetical protein